MLFWTLQAGVHHRVLCIQQDRHCPSGCGSEWDRDIEGELLILSECSPDIHIHWTVVFASLPQHSHSCALPLVSCSPLGKSSQVCQLSVNRCVLWVRGMWVCGNLQTLIWAANKHHCQSELTASKNKYVNCWTSLCSEFIIGRVELASIVLMDLNPHSFPLDLEHSVSGNTQVLSLFHFILNKEIFHNSLLEQSIISAALPLNYPTEK